MTYYTDTYALKIFERENQEPIKLATNLLKTFKENTGFDVTTWQDLVSIGNDPGAYFRGRYFHANEKKFNQFRELRLPIQDIIELPENFTAVMNAANAFKKIITGKEQNFTLEKGEVIPSEKAIARINSKVYFTATTPEQKKRLEICLKMIECFKEVLKDIEKQIKPIQFEKVKHECSYARPLPYQLKIVGNLDGTYQLIPNPQYVNESFGGTYHLGFHVFSSIEKKKIQRDAMPKLGEKYVKWYRPMMGGTNKLFTCLEKEYHKHKMPLDELLPGTYNELGDVWGTPIDLLKPRTIKETFYTPLR